MADRTNYVGRDIGDYHLLRRLGGGGFGDVYLGEHVRTQAQAAIKVLQMHLTRSEDLKEFINEARTFRLRHPHIIPLLDFGIDSDDVPYLVMEYASNGTLRDTHPKGTRVPLSTILSYVVPLASALQYAHDQHLIHRDVKPENMLLDTHNTVLLSDFGIAAVAHSSRSLNTQEGIGGTLPYMAPEQIQGKPRPASDQYALGIVVYEWLTGARPFRGTTVEIVTQHSTTPPPPLREQVPTLSPDVEQVVLTALAKDPKHRFATVTAFARALQQAGEERDASPRSAPPPPVFHTSPLPATPMPRPPVEPVEVEAPLDTDQVSVHGPLHPVSFVDSPPLVSNPAASPLQPVSGATNDVPALVTEKPMTRSDQPPLSEIHFQYSAPPQSLVQKQGASIVATPPPVPFPGRKIDESHGRKKSIRQRFVALGLFGLALIIAVGSCAILAYSNPTALGAFGKALPIGVTTATVTITPKSVDLKNQYLITGVTGTPDSTRRQVQARQFSADPGSQSQTVNATGHVQTPGANAHGILTFQNSLNSVQTVRSGMVFTASNGVQVVNDVAVNIPGAGNSFGQVSVSAHAIASGAAGNIGLGAISQVCCSTDNTIRVSNTSVFTGGQDAQNFTLVQQSDIDGAANPIKIVLSQKAQQQFQAQIRPNEQLVGPAQCNSKVSSDHNAGDHATTVTVTVSATCTGEAYDHLGALGLVQTLFRTEAATNPGAGYALVGDLQTSITQANIIDPNKGTVSLTIPAEGIWVYQVDDAQKQRLAKLIAGKSSAEASQLLQQQAGIQKSDIQIDHGDGNTLPTNTANITIVVQNVPGLQGAPTPGGPGGTSTPSTIVVPTSPGGPGNNQTPTPGLGGS